MASNSIKLLTGNSHPQLAELVAKRYVGLFFFLLFFSFFSLSFFLSTPLFFLFLDVVLFASCGGVIMYKTKMKKDEKQK